MTIQALRVAALALAVLIARPASADLAGAEAAYGKLLSKYATERGVRYDSWRASGPDIKKLSEIVAIFRSTDPATLTPDERKALYINMYNARILETVLLGYPKGSIRDLSKGMSSSEIFDRKGLNFDGKALSLNDLEKRLRDEFHDPRIHFAVNCAARSCPPIRAEAYVAARLDQQLDDATRSFLASPGALTVRGESGKTTIVASKLFDWYALDFKAAGGALAFIAKYGPASATEAVALGKVRLEFAEYDWGLNAAK